jgi:hypothetical protein
VVRLKIGKDHEKLHQLACTGGPEKNQILFGIKVYRPPKRRPKRRPKTGVSEVCRNKWYFLKWYFQKIPLISACTSPGLPKIA